MTNILLFTLRTWNAIGISTPRDNPRFVKRMYVLPTRTISFPRVTRSMRRRAAVLCNKRYLKGSLFNPRVNTEHRSTSTFYNG